MWHSIVLAVNMEAVQMGIAPPHGELNGIVEIGDRLIAPQQNAPPDHRAHAPQHDLELVDANHRCHAALNEENAESLLSIGSPFLVIVLLYEKRERKKPGG
jgi:hypothetical protein